MTTLQFLRLGAATPFVQGVQSEKYPYSVSLNPHTTPTLKEAEILLTSAHVESLQERVQLDPKKPTEAIVDKFFRVRYKAEAPRNLAVKTWSRLFWNCKKIQYVSGIFAIGLTLLALQGPPVYIVIASYVGAVASTCLFGWSLHRYRIAEKQLAVWRSPGEHFAQKRKAALELPLHEMSKKKCHFHPAQPTGTLLGVEIFSVFRRDFKQFATPLLDRTCNTPAEQHQWVLDFFKGNPFGITFFVDNPHLSDEPGWKKVLMFQEQFNKLTELLKSLEKSYVAQFNTNQDAAKQKYEAIQKSVLDKAKAFCEGQKMVPLRVQLFHSRILSILDEECLSKIHALSKRHKGQADYPCSIVFPQVRALLEEAQKGLLEDQPYTLDATAFADEGKFIPKNIQEELDAITANYPQNVIDKAKAVDSVPLYHQFIDAAFNP